VKGKLANGVGSQYSHGTSERGISSFTKADTHTSGASSRLNRLPHRFKWTRPFRRKTKCGFCACAIRFRTRSNFMLHKQRGCLRSRPSQRFRSITLCLPLHTRQHPPSLLSLSSLQQPWFPGHFCGSHSTCLFCNKQTNKQIQNQVHFLV